MSMKYGYGWWGSGVVQEVRRLLSKKTGEAWAVEVKLATLGDTLAIRCEVDIEGQVKPGDEIRADGLFDEFNGKKNLVLATWEPLTESTAKGAPGKGGTPRNAAAR